MVAEVEQRFRRIEVLSAAVAEEQKRLRDINAELLAALERSEQYIICAIYNGKTGAQRLSKETIALAESDLEMVRAAIAKAKP